MSDSSIIDNSVQKKMTEFTHSTRKIQALQTAVKPQLFDINSKKKSRYLKNEGRVKSFIQSLLYYVLWESTKFLQSSLKRNKQRKIIWIFDKYRIQEKNIIKTLSQCLKCLYEISPRFCM